MRSKRVCSEDLRPVLDEMVSECVFGDLVSTSAVSISAVNAALLTRMNEQLASRLMRRAALFAQQRTQTTGGVGQMRHAKVALLKEDVENGRKSLQ
jgi:hypothetical protein